MVEGIRCGICKNPLRPLKGELAKILEKNNLTKSFN